MMERRDRELKSVLTEQSFGVDGNYARKLEEAKENARGFVSVTDGIAVLSDFNHGKCHTYSGKFGKEIFSLQDYSLDENSPFEDEIFNTIIKDDLIDRHILELRFFNFVKRMPLEHRTDYQLSCVIRFMRPGGAPLPVLHNSRYLHWHDNGAMWLGLCTYVPLPIADAAHQRGIIDISTGETIGRERYSQNDSKLLSKRQIEILRLLAKGEGSKQIADRLNISVHTVNRHRQDILTALKVANSTSAVDIGVRLHLI